MAFDFRNLDGATRAAMLGELAEDVRAKNVYLSNRLTSEGQRLWPAHLKTAIEERDPEWLAGQILRFLLDEEHYVDRDGETRWKKVPRNAHALLAEGEFNRLYVRGVCTVAIDAGIAFVVVYRAKESSSPRRQSEMLIGRQLDPAHLRQSVRDAKGKAPELLPEVNSGLSVYFTRLAA